MKYEFIHQGDRFFSFLPSRLPPFLFFKTPVYAGTEVGARTRTECSLAVLFSRVGERAMRIARLRVGVRLVRDCVRDRTYVRIRMEVRKEAGHEQWLAALRNNVVFVGWFYLPRQECSLQSASKFKPRFWLIAQPDRTDRSSVVFRAQFKLSSPTGSRDLSREL